MVGLERLLIGRTLDGRYTIEELIGHGRGGLVYRARHGQTGVEVALKVLSAPRTPEARERFRKMVSAEVKVAAAIEHPNLAGVYCLGHDPELDLDFVTTELLRGQTLASVLSQRGKPPIALGLRLLADAAEGLSAGHRAGLVHRDVRPASLYLVRSDTERQVRVKVAGFGVPQIVRRESLAGAAPEIRAYASPEILAAGSLRLTPASDVFSLGVVGYELLTGAFPFSDAALQALAEGRAVEADPPRDVAASVPPQVVDAVLQALRGNPAERFADGAAFSAALQQTARHVVAVGKISPAAASTPPAPVSADVAPATAETAPAAPEPSVAAPVVAAAIASAAAVADAPVVDVADLAADEPEADVPDLSAEAVAAITPDPADAPAEVSPVAPPAVDAAAVAAATSAAAMPAAVTPVAAPPAAAAALPPDLTRAPVKKPAIGKPGAPDLELYYPPQIKKPPVAAPVMPPLTTPRPAAPVEAATPTAAAAATPVAAPVAEGPPPVVAQVPTPVAPPAPVAPAPVAAEILPASPRLVETPAYAPVPAEQPAAETAVTPLASTRRRQAAAAGGMRGSAMAAGFVLGIAVLGSVAWIATRHGARPEDAAASPVANRLAQGPATTPAATPAQPATDSQAASPAAATADTASRTTEQRAADLRKKQQDDERRRQEEEKLRQAQLLQQQQLAQQQARPGAQPAAPQPAPAQPQPQQVAVAQPQRPAAQPVAPPPAPPPAPAAREEAAETPASNAVFGEDAVEERARLANGSEVQRALQSRYPPQLQSAHISGRVTASFVVGADGRVDPGSIRIVSSPNPGFNDPTVNVLRRARFRPARVKGQPVRSQTSMSIAWTAEQ